MNIYTYWPTSGKDIKRELQKSPAASVIEGMQKGTRLRIVPLSAAYGDDITALGINSTFSGDAYVELNEPFNGFLEEFDGETVRMRTDQYYNLKVSVADIKNAVELPADSDSDKHP